MTGHRFGEWITDTNHRHRQYWTFQFLGWSAFTILSYFSLTVWYNPGELTYLEHTILQSVLGLLISHPLRLVASRSWTLPLWMRIVTNSIGILIAALIWTYFRLSTLSWLTGEVVSRNDWGGWINASIIVFGAWSFCYHALRYYRDWTLQKDETLKAISEAQAARLKAQEESLKRVSLEAQHKDVQLRMLKYQLSPHFLFNSLNSVTALVRKGHSDNATNMLSLIGDLLRISLEEETDLSHTLEEELGIIDLYLAIEKYRFQDRLQTHFSISPEAKRVKVPSFILQPLFENAMKYAVGRRTTPTLIECTASVEGPNLVIVIMDDGPGLQRPSGTDPTDSPGIGLKNLTERLQTHYRDDYAFTISDRDPEGVICELRMPAYPTMTSS